MASSPPALNLLLEKLPPQTREILMRQLEPLDLPVRTVLYEAQSSPRYVHFITSGLASVVTVLSGGNAVEVGLVGREGLVEKIHLLGPQTLHDSLFHAGSRNGRPYGLPALRRVVFA